MVRLTKNVVEYLTLAQASRELGLRPTALSVALSRGKVTRDQLDVVGGRLMVRRDQMGWLRELLSGFKTVGVA